jgi:hypothetical protein
MAYLGNRPDAFQYTSTSYQQLSGDGVTTTFTLSRQVSANGDIEVVVNNVPQEPGVAYYVSDLINLNFTAPPSAAANNIYIVYRAYVQSGIAPAANTVTTSAIAANTIQPWQLTNSLLNPIVNTFTANGTGTTYTLAFTPPSANAVVVTINGITQNHPENYSTNGTTLTFTDPPAANSVIRVLQQAVIGTSIVPIDGSVSTSKLADGSVTTSKLASGLTLSSANLSGGSINDMTIGGTTANTGAFTTLSANNITTSGNVIANTARVNLLDIVTGANNAYLHYDDNITGWTYTGKSFSVAGQETIPSGIFFKPDGTKMYVIGSTGDDVNEYNLSTPWEVNTATFVQASVALVDTAPTGIFFRDDGAKMYMIGTTNDTVYEYNLSTPWNVSTLSLFQSFSVASQELTPQDIWFKPDGTKMYVTGSSGDSVYEYNLSSAWNVTTASFLQSFSVAAQETTPVAVNFSADGTKMYVLGATGDDINRYDLSVAWDISTAVFYNNFYIGFQEINPAGMFINKESGIEAAYVVGSTADTVFQYRTESNSLSLDTRNLFVDGSLYANNNLQVSGAARIEGSLVSGAITGTSFSGAVAATSLTSSAGVTMSATTQTITIGDTQTTGPIIVGGSTGTGTITVGRSSGTQSVNISGAPIVLTKGQLQFPATQNASADANTLDDYEEGTWTPTWSSGTATYRAQVGRYTKIGNVVYYNCKIASSSVTGMSSANINGLPFAASSSNAEGYTTGSTFCVIGFENLGSAGIAPQISPGLSRIELYIVTQASGDNYTPLTASALNEGSELNLTVTGFYFV